MDKPILKKIFFLIFDLNSDLLTEETVNNEILKYDDKINSELYNYYDNINFLIEEYFMKKLIGEEFTDEKWKVFGYLVKKYHKIHNNNLTLVSHDEEKFPFKENLKKENLKKENLNDFIIKFIQNNFLIIKNSIEINNKPELWYQADTIKPYRIFHQDLIIFEGYNLNKLNSNFKKLNIFKGQSLKYIFNNINQFEQLKEGFGIKIYEKLQDLEEKYNSIINKITLMKKANEINLKEKKNISFSNLVDLISKQNSLAKDIIEEKQNLQNGILFISSIKNNL